MSNRRAAIYMAEALESLALDEVPGLVQGLSPRPLVTSVISETLKFGKIDGFKVALSPLIRDSTIIVLALRTLYEP